MSAQLTIKSAVNHTDSFISKISGQYFSGEEKITGDKLPNLTPIKSFNFILIYILLQTWKSNAKKFRSPYFDFENEEVKTAMEEFMNVVSNHISIRKEDFEPLVKKSYQLTLLYYNDVLVFLNEIFSEKVTKQELLELNKFVRSESILGIILFLDDNNLDKIILSELEAESVFKENQELFLSDLVAFLGIESHTPIEEKIPVATVVAEEPEETMFEVRIEEKIVEVPQEKINSTLNDAFVSTPIKTLNDTHAQQSEVVSLNEQKEITPKSIKERINLNEQLFLINSIFGGIKDDYLFFIDTLDNAETMEKANFILNANIVKEKYLVQYEYLKNIIEKKFVYQD